jgi:hypothetical protein
MLCTNAIREEQCELITLTLDYCGLTDQCVPFLSETLQHRNCKLAILGLSGNNFTAKKARTCFVMCRNPKFVKLKV